LRERGARVCIPPREKACPWKEQEGFEKQRNAAIEAIGAHGKARWKREVGYHWRSLAETAMFRIKTLFGERLMAREFDRQAVEAGIRVSALIPLPYWACHRVYASVKHKRPCRQLVF
jgi:hypothetical protein